MPGNRLSSQATDNGNDRWNTAPPSVSFSAQILPCCSKTMVSAMEIALPGLERRPFHETAQAADYFVGAPVVAPDIGEDFPDLIQVGRLTTQYQFRGLGIRQDRTLFFFKVTPTP